MATNPIQQWQAYLAALRGNFTKIAKLEFLQPDNSIAFAVDTNYKNKRSNAFIQEGTLSANLQNGMRRQASITLSNTDGEYDYNVNNIWFGTRIRLQEGLILPDGTEFYIPQGVFYIKDPEDNYFPDRKTVVFNLVDKWAVLNNDLFGTLEGIYEVPVNSPIFDAIASVLLLPKSGVTGDYPIDNVPPLFTEFYNGKTTLLPDRTSVPLTRTPYTYRNDSENGTYADIILALNSMLVGWIGYDQTGRLRLDPSQDDIDDSSKPILWEFTPTEQQFLGASYVLKNSEVYNDVIVQSESTDDYAQVGGRAINQDPASDTNIHSAVGRRPLRLSSSGYYTEQQCKDLAAFHLKRNTVLKKSVTISSTQMFHIVENNLCTIVRPDRGGRVERHLITGFSRPIGQTGHMTINATSVNDFPNATIV